MEEMINIIRNLEDYDKIKLLNNIESMPSKINKYVKIHINEYIPDHKGEVVLHDYSTLTKYFNRNIVKKTNNINEVTYQSEYCKLQQTLDSLNLDKPTERVLRNFIDYESYDETTFSKLEIEIANLVADVKTKMPYENFIKTLEFINFHLIPYKSLGYCFYSYLILQEYGDNISSIFNSIILNINTLLMTSPVTYSVAHDLAIMIYCYFKQIGVDSCLEKYNLMDRFEYFLEYRNADTDYIEEMEKKVIEYSKSKIKLTDIACGIVNQDILNTSSSKDENQTYADVDSNMIQDGTILLFKNISDIVDKKDFIVQQLHILNKSTISEYMDGITADDIMFYLTDNDIGHLIKKEGFTIGTAYDTNSYKMKYIGIYNDEFYLFFKSKSRSDVILGISLNQNGNTRKILEFYISKDYYYKYISNI